MASATSPFAWKEKANYYRLYRLLVEAGSEVLRKTFDRVRPSGELHELLAVPRIHAKLRSLWQKDVLSSSQWDKLYPAVRSSVSSEYFDTALLGILLMNICNLNSPETDWSGLPLITDTTIQADITRLRIYYSIVHGLAKKAEVDDTKFNICFKNIQDILVRLGGAVFRDAIDDLRNELLDAECEEHYNKLFKQETRKELTLTDRLFMSTLVAAISGVEFLTGRIPAG